MVFRRLISVILALGLLGAACGGDDISAETCGEVVDETLELFQRLINDVDGSFGEMTVEELIATGGDLPSVADFTDDAEKINQIGVDLGCTQADTQAAVSERIDEITTTSDLGRFLIDAVRTGGL